MKNNILLNDLSDFLEQKEKVRQKETENLQKLYDQFDIELIKYNRFSNETYFVFKDKSFLRTRIGEDSLSCTYIIPEEENHDLLPTNTNINPEQNKKLRENIEQYMCLGAFSDIKDKKYVAAGSTMSAKHSFETRLMELVSCESKINNEQLKKTSTSIDISGIFTEKLHSVKALYEKAQHYYNMCEGEKNIDFALPFHPLIESRFVYERIYGFYLGRQKEIREKLNKSIENKPR